MRLGFFGGAFNPPSIAHLNLVEQALEECKLDKIYFVPVNNFYKKQGLLDIDVRIDMLELMCKHEKNILVSTIEKDNNIPFKANEIFSVIKEKYSHDDVFFLMGEDNYKKIETWENYDKLKEYNYIVFQRNENTVLEINNEKVYYMKNKENIKVSSTMIRKKIDANQPIDKYVTKDVERYILKNNLYK